MLDKTLVSFRNFEEVFKSVAAGKADAAVANHLIGSELSIKYRLLDSSIVFNPSRLYFAAGRGTGNDDLIESIDKHLRRMKSDPASVYYRALKRLSIDSAHFLIPPWIRVSVMVIVPILLISIIASIILKRQVDIRTYELRISIQEMEQRVIERTAEVTKAMHHAQEADQIKSSFLAVMSHELRTPLNSIIGFTGIMLQELAGPLNDEQKKQLNMVRNSSRHLLSLINDVLDISKIEARQLDLVAEPFNLLDSIHNTLKLISPMAEKKGIEVRTDIANNISTVVSDKRRIEQILLNLLSNAVKFTENGFVRLDCELDGDMIKMRVKDTGIGIEEDDMEHLFQPFSQVDTGLSRKYDGTGLGLSICKKLLALMGGTIVVRSKAGKGSTFEIQFPVNKEKSNA